jgi:hypothetical protein
MASGELETTSPIRRALSASSRRAAFFAAVPRRRDDLMGQSRAAPRQRRFAGGAIAVLVSVGALGWATAGARAAEWVERPFDPPVGSRWVIQLDTSTEEDRDGRLQKTTRSMTSELTIEQKLADGFRVSYVVRKAAYEGDPRTAGLVEPLNKLFENLVVHATTSANGTPLHIDNLDEVEATAQAAIDRLAAASASKAEADTLRRLANQMLLADAEQAPKIYLSSLATLALGQNTGLHPGETRRAADEAHIPFGGAPIKSNTMLAIDNADPVTGKVRFVRTAEYDPDSVREFLSKLARRLGTSDTRKLDEVLSQLALVFDSRAEIDVDGGMTRSFRQDDTATATFEGHTTVKRAHKLLTVTPAP